jgi:hypothetical protein
MEPDRGDLKVNEASEAVGFSATLVSAAVSIWLWFEQLISTLWSSLGWPHAVLIMFLLSVSCYRLEFKALIERILEFGPGGIKLQAPVFQASRVESAEVRVADIEASPLSFVSPPAIQNKGIPLPPTIVFPEQMRLSQEAVSNEVSGMTDSEAKTYLIPRLAMARSMYVFENCYSCIFGGQIRLLQIINQRPGKSLTMQEVYSFWLALQEQQKPVLNLWSGDQYLNYLIQNGLVLRGADAVELTTKGTEFVLWLTQYGRPLERPY